MFIKAGHNRFTFFVQWIPLNRITLWQKNLSLLSGWFTKDSAAASTFDSTEWLSLLSAIWLSGVHCILNMQYYIMNMQYYILNTQYYMLNIQFIC